MSIDRGPVVSDFVIQEILDPNESRPRYGKRRITLSGRGLPFRPLRFGGTVAASKKHHAGNPEAIIQILHTNEKDTTIRGQWKTAYIGSPVASEGSVIVRLGENKLFDSRYRDEDAMMMELCRALDEFRVASPIVDVAWMGQSHRGIMLGFDYEFLDAYTVNWEMTFMWKSYHQRRSLANVVRREALPENLPKDWAAKLKDFENYLSAVLGFDSMSGAYTNVPGVTDFFNTIDDINQQIFRLRDASSTLRRINSMVVDSVVKKPNQLMRNVLQGLTDVKSVFVDIASEWTATSLSEYGMSAHKALAFESTLNDPAGFDGIIFQDKQILTSQFAPSSPIDSSASIYAEAIEWDSLRQEVGSKIGIGSALSAVRAAQYGAIGERVSLELAVSDYEVKQRLEDLVYLLENDIKSVERIVAPDVQQVVIATDGQHLGRIAEKFFSFESWRAIAIFNGLDSAPLLEGGTIILIPSTLPEIAV